MTYFVPSGTLHLNARRMAFLSLSKQRMDDNNKGKVLFAVLKIFIILLYKYAPTVEFCQLKGEVVSNKFKFIRPDFCMFTFAICCRPSVRRLLSVTPVRPTQAVVIFHNISTALGTLVIR